MNKAELVQAMADDAGLSKSDAEKALNAFVEIVGGELGKGGKVQLVCIYGICDCNYYFCDYRCGNTAPKFRNIHLFASSLVCYLW